MKKLLFIYDFIYPYQIGGVQQRIYNISTYLKDEYEIHLVGMKDWEGDNTIVKDKIYYHAITKHSNIYKPDGTRKTLEPIIFAIKLFPYLLKNNFDVIEIESMPYFPIFTLRLALLFKFRKPKGLAPRVITVWHEWWSFKYWVKYSGLFSGSIGFIVQYLALKLSVNIISISEHTKKEIEKYKKDDIVVIPNGIRDDIKTIPNKKKEYDLCYAGRLLDFKNIDKIIDLVKYSKEKNIKLKAVIIGDGPEINNLKTKAKNLDIEFTGFIENNNEVFKDIQKSKIFMMLSEREGFSIVTIEALALGLPVICFNSKDNAAVDLIEDKVNGLLIALDKKEMLDAIGKINKNYSNYSKNATKYASRFLYSKISKEIENYYNKS
ncbi:MAG: glycosyltransferase family 4 protein [Patescibacteria group bacterium]